MTRAFLTCGVVLSLHLLIAGASRGEEQHTGKVAALRASATNVHSASLSHEMVHSQPGCTSCCETSCCDSSGECDPAHHHKCWLISPGNMFPHTPYVAEPKLYYYFRPYNWYHIPAQQESVMSFGGDPRHPYTNYVFKGIYKGLE